MKTSRSVNLKQYLLQLLLSITFWSFIALVVLIFKPVRFIVNKVLRLKYGDRYGGLMDCADSFYLEHNPAMEPYNATIMVFKAKKGENFMAHVVGKIKKLLDEGDAYKKLTGSIKVFLGYEFIIKGTTKLSDVVVQINKPKTEPFDMNYIEKYIAEQNSKRFTSTDDGQILWDMHITKDPLDGSADGYDRFILISRFHHGLADGTSLIGIMIRFLGDDRSQNYTYELFKKFTKSTVVDKNIKYTEVLKTSVQSVKFWLTAIFQSPGRFQLMNQLKERDMSALHGPELSGQKIVATAVEEKAECIPLIKEMRKCDKSIKFSNVVATGVAHSFTNFYKRNKQPVPEFLTGLLTMLLSLPPGDSEKPVPLKNKTAAACFELPMMHKTPTLCESLVKISHSMNSQLQYEDFLIAKLSIVDLGGLLPMNYFRGIYGLQAQTFMLTNIPGGSTITVNDNIIMEKCIGVAPNLQGIGVTVAIISYDDRFQISLQVDQAIINSREEVKRMAEDILTTIRKLGQEVLNR